MLDKNKKASAGPQDKTVAEPVFALGRQLTLEYYDCSPEALLDKTAVENALLRAARDSGATVISASFHQFVPQGVSGVVIIAESHFTIHAWPEHNYAAVDIFTCGDNIDLDRAIHAMQASFDAGRVVVSSDMNRGLLADSDDPGHGTDTACNTPETALSKSDTLPISWQKTWEAKNPSEVSVQLDLYACDPDVVQEPEAVQRFSEQLRPRSKDLTAGDFRIIESARVSGRLDRDSNTVYLDVASPSFYEPREVAEFAGRFFGAGHYKLRVALRQ
ncbi:MAG TPA: adenosylmethionine decarboxylase [Desulfobacteraceae bacterium]|nr:adenosylmethionine decarboxylase [Desulfobacteraceae bacterium]|tara:strand:- start:273 stop:1094 length:822 start_codon:yes stop_codon:yes gene_type:complete